MRLLRPGVTLTAIHSCLTFSCQKEKMHATTILRFMQRIASTRTGLVFFHCATKPQGLLGTGEWRWRKRKIIYPSLHCHHQNDSCIKMGSDESHFNVSLIVKDKVTRRCPQTTTFKEKGEPKRNRTGTVLLTSLTPYR